MTSTTVFVSGATGFIAQHVIKQLINKGYDVVGSVRSSEKGDKLKKLLNSDKFTYEVVEAIEEEGAFDESLKNHPEVTVFLHTASPVTFQVHDIEKEILTPAIAGTRNVLASIKKFAPQVKKVVVTSSIAAMISGDPSDPNVTINENSWNPVTWEQSLADPFMGYFGSKTFAEKAAWDFVKSETPSFSISFVNPVYVFGPQAFDESAKGVLNASAEIVNSIVNLKKGEEIPTTSGGFVDVRDVAAAHLIAFEKDEAENQRLILAESTFVSQDILDLLHQKFPEFASNLPEGTPGSGKNAKFAVVDSSKSREILRIKFHTLEESVVDSVNQILTSK